jgi:hypothetical protein
VKPHVFPVSVKGVAVQAGRVLLLENERDEWELPYGCHVLSTAPPVVSHEHKRAALFAPDAIPGLAMPVGYKHSITTWLAHPGSTTSHAPS